MARSSPSLADEIYVQANVSAKEPAAELELFKEVTFVSRFLHADLLRRS